MPRLLSLSRRRLLKGHDAPTVTFNALMPLAEEPGLIIQVFNRQEIAELSRALKGGLDGPDGVVVIRFSLSDIVDELHGSYLSPPAEERAIAFEAWALAFEAAAVRIRQAKARPPALDIAPDRARSTKKKRRRQKRA